METISIKKQLQIIKLYFSGNAFSVIAEKVGVSQGTVSNIITKLKDGFYPDISTIPEEIEVLRDMAIEVKKTGLNPVQAIIGLSVITTLDDINIEPADLEKVHTLLKTLTPPGLNLPAMAQSVLNIEQASQAAGLDLQSFEEKITTLKQQADTLVPLSIEAEAVKSELSSLKDQKHNLEKHKASLEKEIQQQQTQLEKIKNEEIKRHTFVASLEERAHNADAKLTAVRKDLDSLKAIGMNQEGLSKFNVKLTQVAAQHNVKKKDLPHYLLTQLALLDQGFSLDSQNEKKKEASSKLDKKIQDKEAKNASLEQYGSQLKSEVLSLEKTSNHKHKLLNEMIAGTTSQAEAAINQIAESVDKVTSKCATDVQHITASALEAGTAIGKLEEAVNSSKWLRNIKALISGGLPLSDSEFRYSALMVLRALHEWLRQKNDKRFENATEHIGYSMMEFDKWKP